MVPSIRFPSERTSLEGKKVHLVHLHSSQLAHKYLQVLLFVVDDIFTWCGVHLSISYAYIIFLQVSFEYQMEHSSAFLVGKVEIIFQNILSTFEGLK